MGFLTREERLVFLTLSICLLAGGIFQLIDSVFELPEEISPPSQGAALSRGEEYGVTETALEGAEFDGGRTGSLSSPATGTDESGAADDESGAPEEAIGASAGRGDSRRASALKGKAPRLQTRLDLNTATASELDALPGIGPALAARILEKRKIAGGFRSVDELLTVRGIGKKTLAKFRQWVYVSYEK